MHRDSTDIHICIPKHAFIFPDYNKMHGSRRVVIFCLLTTVLPSLLIIIPLYLRNIKYADVMYKISDSDVIQIHKGQSSIFCEKHSLKMNSTFNAFQMKGRPELSEKRKHIRLKKSMILPDDTLEYWGFYLFKGATVELKACSRYDGSKLLVVKGDKMLNTCGILDEDKYKRNRHIVQNQAHVVATLENPNKKNKPIPDVVQNAIEDETFFDEKENDIDTKYKDFQDQSSTLRNRERFKRNAKIPLHNPNTVLDAGVNHGGNAINLTTNDSSVSSFESSLYECYHDNMLLNRLFPYSIQCNSTDYLKNTTTLKVVHNVSDDGYYYYIFYSDNDLVSNDIHVIFDIYKPTFQYVNMSASKVCVNKTECEFDVGFFSDELVIVEVPTSDGLRNDDDASILVSVCHPRVSVYVIFPILVLLLIFLFAFL